MAVQVIPLLRREHRRVSGPIMVFLGFDPPCSTIRSWLTIRHHPGIIT